MNTYGDKKMHLMSAAFNRSKVTPAVAYFSFKFTGTMHKEKVMFSSVTLQDLVTVGD